jgi:hypothetical protein
MLTPHWRFATLLGSPYIEVETDLVKVDNQRLLSSSSFLALILGLSWWMTYGWLGPLSRLDACKMTLPQMCCATWSSNICLSHGKDLIQFASCRAKRVRRS